MEILQQKFKFDDEHTCRSFLPAPAKGVYNFLLLRAQIIKNFLGKIIAKTSSQHLQKFCCLSPHNPSLYFSIGPWAIRKLKFAVWLLPQSADIYSAMQVCLITFFGEREPK